MKGPKLPDISFDTLSLRLARLGKIRLDVASGLARGAPLCTARLITGNPDLMPELEQELRLLESTHRRLQDARRIGVADSDVAEYLPSVPGYRIEKELSQGGQGTVFLARQLATSRQIAVKVLAGGALLLRRRQARLEREVAILASLNHPNIVGIFDHGRTADGSFFMAMNYIDGLELDAWLQEQRRLAASPREFLDRVLELFIKVADAAGEAHARGVVHRDLKPSNIRVDARGEPHLLDFGLARQAGDDSLPHGSVTVDGQVVGSLPWLSPEQAAGANSEVGAASDVYAIGVMLYEGLTGQQVYSRDGTLADVLSRVQQMVPTPPSRIIQLPDARLDAIVMQALAKCSSERYGSAAELAADLRSYRAGGPINAACLGRGRRGRSAVAACIAGVVVLGFWRYAALPTPPATPVSRQVSADRPETLGSAGAAPVARLPASARRLVLTPVADAFVRNGGLRYEPLGVESADNSDNFRTLEVQSLGSAQTRDAYLRFDLSPIPPDAVIYRVTLRLHGRATAVGRVARETVHAIQLFVCPLREPATDWDEQTLTWDNRPFIVGYNDRSRALTAFGLAVGADPRWHETDLTAAIQAERTAGRVATTIVLHNPQDVDVLSSFDSSETDHPPELHLYYEPGPDRALHDRALYDRQP